MFFKRALITAIGCAALSACNTAGTHIGDEDPAIGEAVKYNAAIQTINPAPVYAADAAKPGDNGDRGAQTVKRYRTDKVNERHRQESESARSGGLSTTSTISGGGGGPH